MSRQLEVEDLSVQRGGRRVLENVSLVIPAGHVTALLGPNGAGKSSLVLTLAGLVRPEAGSVRLDGEPLGRSPERIRAAGLAAVPEGHRILTKLTVRENLAIACNHLPKGDAQAVIDEAWATFPELKPRAEQRAGTLSGGEQQMLALSQALIIRPRVLLADEMSLGLAPRVIERLMGVLVDLARSGVAVLLIEQFTSLALQLAQNAYVMHRGRIQYGGPASELAQDPDRLHAAYLGTR